MNVFMAKASTLTLRALRLAGVDQASILKVYLTTVGPVLEYAVPVWQAICKHLRYMWLSNLWRNIFLFTVFTRLNASGIYIKLGILDPAFIRHQKVA